MTSDTLRYLRLACATATQQSDDPHTQNGAVLVSKRGDIVAAANGFPDNVLRHAARTQRPQKYSYIEHAERNVIYAAAKIGIPTYDATLYCPWFACADCARAIICAGITNVVGLLLPDTNGSWKASMDIADEMFGEARVSYVRLNIKLGVSLLRNGQLVEL